jgi:hypothetical protein
MFTNPLFIVEITEPSEEDVLMKSWRSDGNGQKLNEDVFNTYYLKRAPGTPADEVCRLAAPHLFCEPS